MSGIYESAVVATASMWCMVGSCDARWESEPYTRAGWDAEVRACAPAFAAGWRVYAGARTQHAYCPEHSPKTAMRLLYPAGGTR